MLLKQLTILSASGACSALHLDQLSGLIAVFGSQTPSFLLGELDLPLKLLNMSLFRPQTSTQLTEFIVFLVRCSHVLLQLRLTDLQACNRFTAAQYLPVDCNTRQHNQQQTAANHYPRQPNHVHARDSLYPPAQRAA
ncbi:hypothetical protein [Pseudomonas aeruginosa]|uniref:hypothetical protein n=1 Tax=Pseudomonas aeruginosa TaxID=287 RepID=UPI0005BC3D0E|nr:hypothetical protein [Pseudomonas aeruginosa]